MTGMHVLVLLHAHHTVLVHVAALRREMNRRQLVFGLFVYFHRGRDWELTVSESQCCLLQSVATD